jgi:hypothetical protein
MTYTEKQKFTQPILWIFILTIAAITVLPIWYMFFKQIFMKEPIGDKPMSDLGITILFFGVLFTMGGIIWLLYKSELTTKIDEVGIHYQLWPFHRKLHTILWSGIISWEVVEYRPLRDYGGWGIRYGREGKAYNVQGNKGLKLTLIDEQKILIGTMEHQRLESFLKQLDPLAS